MRWRNVAVSSAATSLAGAVALLGALCGPLGGTVGSGVALTAAASRWPTTTSDPTTGYNETDNVPITMSDGVILEANEYIPTTCTTTTKCPVILIQTLYGSGNSTEGPGDEVKV